jgi:hypothetical protein
MLWRESKSKLIDLSSVEPLMSNVAVGGNREFAGPSDYFCIPLRVQHPLSKWGARSGGDPG